MPQPNDNQLVGLIVIESPGQTERVPPLDIASHDATLTEFLSWLAHGHSSRSSQVDETNRTLESHLGAVGRANAHRRCNRFPGRSRPALVMADCRGLDAQLERALTGFRRKLAAV